MERSIQNIDAFKSHKQIPKSIEKATLVALSHYPELRRVPIRFQFKKEIKNMVMNAQPELVSMFRLMEQRKYVVNISRTIKLGSQAMKIEDLPQDVLVGWIGHELGHVMDYESRSVWGMVAFGLNYWFSPNFVKGAERRADEIAVLHDLTEFIVHTKNYILNHAEIPVTYKNKMKKLYLSPEEILRMVDTDQHAQSKAAFS